MNKPKLPRLFHLFKSCPDSSWIDGEQVVQLIWSDDGKQVEAYVDDGEESYYIFEDQEVDLLEGTGKVTAVEADELVEVDFETPRPIRVTNDNWEEYLPEVPV